MKWFKHDTDASIDAKLQELLLDYGASGYGLYWYCVELIAQNVDEKNITFELEHDARIIARNLNLTVQETKDMMHKMIELELFSISKNEKLACYTLAKRLDQSMTSNKGFREVISKIKEQSHDKVMISHDKVMQEENREEESRVDENTSDKNKPLPYQIINEYKTHVSNLLEKINEKWTMQELRTKKHDLNKIIIGIKNYGSERKGTDKIHKLDTFIGSKIYLDYQEEKKKENSLDGWK